MRYLSASFLATLVVLMVCGAARAQTPDLTGIGRVPSAQEVQAKDFIVGSNGKELPPGKGTAKEGAAIYAQKCAVCHGATGIEAKFQFGRLVGGRDSLTTPYDMKTTESYWPHATSIWGFIRESMPQAPLTPTSLPKDYLYPAGQVPSMEERIEKGDHEFVNSGPFIMQGDEELFKTGKNSNLTFDQVYALTAWILWRGNIIKEDEVMNEKTLPKVRMPNRLGFSVMDSDGNIPEWHSRDPKTRIDPFVAPGSKPLPAGSKPVNGVY